MNNPWLKKNPFMSRWLSSAHKVMGRARGQVNAAVKRESQHAVAAATTAATHQVTEFWINASPKPLDAARKRRTPR